MGRSCGNPVFSLNFSLLIPREFSADVLLDANSWWVTGGTGYGGTLATTGNNRETAYLG